MTTFVTGKSDYSNQLIVFADEWELDPAKLKFSTLLGQGAFGKVVTGYYDDQKVAIKLVRGQYKSWHLFPYLRIKQFLVKWPNFVS